MADHSSIEWTDATWNPIVGCSILSPGCTHCYAMGMAARIEAMTAALQAKGQTGAPHYVGTTKKVKGHAIWTGKLAMAPEHILRDPLTWRSTRRIFVNSMGDLFHEDVPHEWIDRVFAVMALSPQHTFQVLTKRAKRMREYVSNARGPNSFPTRDWPLPNVWLGVSAERQQEADERIPELRATPAAVRFVSAEPLLGPIDFQTIIGESGPYGRLVPFNALRKTRWTDGDPTNAIDWIIVGGESGPDARPMHPAWARSIRDQCAAARVPFFFKQWGEWAPQIGAVDGWTLDDNPEISRFEHREWEDGRWSEPFWPMWCDWQDGNYDAEQCVSRIGKKRAGRMLDGVEHNAMPEAR
ncbi:MAG: phage Gp37/Gp68 family protein [Mesorhizobium sp.]|nr:MAG: phage Gp37/Gp68 family protein [Mesorhizobium sp.]